jgi:hypothetical protein
MSKCEYNDAQLWDDLCTVHREANVTEEVKAAGVLEAEQHVDGIRRK